MRNLVVLKLVILLFFSGIDLSINAATITIGTGTTTNTATSYPAPYGNFFWGARHQFLITATELNAAGMTAGNINSLAFDVAQAAGTSLQGFTISMKNTPTGVVTGFETGVTTVYGPQNYTESVGLNVHTLSSPFYWDGTSNLLVETCFNNSSWTQNATTYYSTTSFNSSIFYRADQPSVCNSSNFPTIGTERPNMIFDWTPANIPPTANFSANTTFTCSGLVSFTDLSVNNPTSWYWDFGDGGNDTVQNPTYTYSANGTYNVTLIACNAFGCDTITFNNYITVNTTAPVPGPASCYPSTLTYCCGFGIDNVTFNTINNSSNDGVDGYSDFTCTQTTVFEGMSYTLSIVTSAASTQNYAAWIDFNNDGVINDATERIYTASSQLNTSGSVTIPTGAVLNTPLRMRVSADYDFSAPPMPCNDLDYGQTEDYTVVINTNPNPPISVFTGNPTYTCSGTVCFTDQSLNVPNQWFWEFGDGNSSFQQNPCHTYTADGVYTVTLTTTNANGSDVDSISSYITVNTSNQLTPASCNPATTAYCCGYGIYQVDFNTISFSSADGVDGYQNYSCANNTTVTEGGFYSLTVRTGVNNPQDTRVWIDYDNDGVFNNTNELIMDAPSTYDPTINFTIPSGTVHNTALRMRVSSDVVGTVQSACDANDFGQTEDYGVTILPNTNPPSSDFSASPIFTCSDTICFTDMTLNAPTTWHWDFGDGDTSNVQNPCHYYSAPGVYTVALTTTNAFGQDVRTRFNYIFIDCSNVLMPTQGVQTITACNGTLFDDGGPFGNYSNNTDGVTVIQPGGASQVNLTFNMFDFVGNFPGDTLFVYDGPSTASPLINFYFGNPTPLPVSSTGGAITIRQKTNFNATNQGFQIDWTCTTGLEDYDELSSVVDVYPNPTTGLLNVAIDGFIDLKISSIMVFNLVGQLQKSVSTVSDKKIHQLDVSSLAKGIYLLQIRTQKGGITKKITVQ